MVEGLPKAFSGYEAHPVTLGNFGAQVFQLVVEGRPTLFFKKSAAAYGVHLQGEAARLRWLAGKVLVPEVVCLHEDADGTVLVTTAVSGFDLTHFNGESSAVKRRLTVTLAGALNQFHAVKASDCPFDHSAEKELERLETQLELAAS